MEVYQSSILELQLSFVLSYIQYDVLRQRVLEF